MDTKLPALTHDLDGVNAGTCDAQSSMLLEQVVFGS
jgi:hypothetical protein